MQVGPLICREIIDTIKVVAILYDYFIIATINIFYWISLSIYEDMA